MPVTRVVSIKCKWLRLSAGCWVSRVQTLSIVLCWPQPLSVEWWGQERKVLFKICLNQFISLQMSMTMSGTRSQNWIMLISEQHRYQGVSYKSDISIISGRMWNEIKMLPEYNIYHLQAQYLKLWPEFFILFNWVSQRVACLKDRATDI